MFDIKPKIGIVGLGVLGGAMQKWYEKNGYDVSTYDIHKQCTGMESFNDAEYIFVCVPTPFRDGKCDVSAIESTFAWIPKNKTVIIRSTVPPGTTDYFADGYKGNVYFNPEFLDASKAEYDFEFPERQILGFTKKLDASILEILPKGNREFVMQAKEAEVVKYMGNTFFAMKNVFANMWYDYCMANDIAFDPIREAVGGEPRIGYIHLNPHHKGGRGAGGSCLPKDLAASIGFIGDTVDTGLLKEVKKANDQRLKQSGKTDFCGMYEL